MITFTLSEQTQKNYTVGNALKAAEAYLRSKRINKTCVNAITNRSLDEKITLVQLNDIQSQIIDDSVYYHLP